MMTRQVRFSLLAWFVGLTLPLASSGMQPEALAQVPALIRYQGQAVDSQGVPLEGPYTLTFRLYDAATGGAIVWEEVQEGVDLSEGYFSVLLGQESPLEAMDWSEPCWLGVQVNGESELSPRQQITSVPLAIRAQTAEMVKTSGLTDDAHALVPSGAVLLWAGATCPVGYTRLSALDGRFLVGGSAYVPSAGGSNTKDLSHSHSVPQHTHGNTSVQCMGWNASPGGPGTCSSSSAVIGSNFQGQQTQAGGGGQSGAAGSSTLDVRPAFATIVLCQRD